MAAGIAITHVGLHRTALAYCTVIVILAAVAAASLIFRSRSPAPAPDPPAAPTKPPAQSGHALKDDDR